MSYCSPKDVFVSTIKLLSAPLLNLIFNEVSDPQAPVVFLMTELLITLLSPNISNPIITQPPAEA